MGLNTGATSIVVSGIAWQAVRGWGVRILLVDDEEDLRHFLTTLLSRQGHEVATASGPAEARRVADASVFDLLITDIDMEGGPKGIQLAKELVERNQGMQVIYISGTTHRDELPPGAFLLGKPFASSELLEIVAEMDSGRREREVAPHSPR